MNLKTLLYFFSKHVPKKNYYLLVFLSLIVTFLEAFSIAALLPLFLNQENNFEGKTVQIISNYINLYGFYILLIIILARFFFQTISLIYETSLISSVSKYLQNKIIKKFFDKNLLVTDDINKILREITTDTISVSMIIKHSTIIISEMFVFIFLSFFVLLNSTYTILYSIFICILLLTLIFIYFRNNILFFSQNRAKSAKFRIFQLNYFLNNFYVIKSMGNISKPLNIIEKETKNFFKNWKKLSIFINLSKPTIELTFGFIIIIILIFNSNNLSENMFVSLIAIVRIIPSISRISTSFQSINSFTPLINNIEKSLNDKNYKYSKEKYLHTNERGSIKLENLNFNIKKKKLSLSFKYKKTNKKNIIDVSNNGLVVLTGKSGTGKTSFLLDILINLANINDMEERVRVVSYMPQEIRFSKSDLKFDLTSLNKSNEDQLENSHFSKMKKILFNKRLTSYYKMNQSEFSGGEEKRLGYLRSIIDNPLVLILDEPTENLDFKNEMKIFKEICNQSKNRIVIVSSHNNIFQNNAVEIIDFDQEKK